MAIGKTPAVNISTSISATQVGAASNNGGLKNLSAGTKAQISGFADYISANVDPGKPITAEFLDKAIKNTGDGIPPSLGDALASFAPTEAAQKDTTVDAKAKQAAAATHAQFAFNLPGQSNKQEQTQQNQDFLKQLSGNDWTSSGASLT